MELLKILNSEKQLLDHEHTLKWFKDEQYLPSTVIDRGNLDDWLREGQQSIGERAAERARALIQSYPGSSLDPNTRKELTRIMRRDAGELGLSSLPDPLSQ